MTATRCPALELLELVGDTRRLKNACEEICVPGMDLTGKEINPKMQCRATKLPPRASKDEIACQWEYWIEE